MCGIAGFWLNEPLNQKHGRILKDMAAKLYHRGPDGYGFHTDQTAGLAMGHARLSIIDLDTGGQPLYGPGRDTVLTVNGEFYDYKRIRTRLITDGATFTTKSDSEIALPLYEKHGKAFVEHLRGEFAFSLYDARKQQLMLVRDRFGIKPLFYHIRGGHVYWGSEIKALFAHPDIPRQLSRPGLLHQLMHTMVPGTTAFENIHALKPGHMLILKRTSQGLDISEHEYWDLEFPQEDHRSAAVKASVYKTQVQEKLAEAVALRLEADVPVGCYLSGGMDSCSMLGLASSMQQSPVKAFTISFDHDAYDESAIAREMADKVKAEQEQIRLSSRELYGANYIRTAYHAERTFYNTLGVAKWCMSHRVRECGYRVVVTGEGADELFGGYPAFKRDMFRHGLAPAEQAQQKALLKKMEQSNKLFSGAILAEENQTHLAMEARVGFTPSWIQPWMMTLALARPLLQPDLRRELENYDPIETLADSFNPTRLNKRHPLDKAQYTWSKTMLEGQILNWGGDRVDMANSMESRPAFLDHHLAQYAIQIPPEFRIHQGTEKWILREAMKNILPETLYKREKFAFMAPPAHTEKSKHAAADALIQVFLSEDALTRSEIFDKGAIHQFVEDYRTGKDTVLLNRSDALLNHILCLQMMHAIFIEGREVESLQEEIQF